MGLCIPMLQSWQALCSAPFFRLAIEGVAVEMRHSKDGWQVVLDGK